MKKLFLLLLLMVSCGSDTAEPTRVCNRIDSQEFPVISNEVVCTDREQCITGDVVEDTKYFCVCNTICICFFSMSECVECKPHSVMAIVGGSLCVTEQELRLEVLRGVYSTVKENNSE